MSTPFVDGWFMSIVCVGSVGSFKASKRLSPWKIQVSYVLENPFIKDVFEQ